MGGRSDIGSYACKYASAALDEGDSLYTGYIQEILAFSNSI